MAVAIGVTGFGSGGGGYGRRGLLQWLRDARSSQRWQLREAWVALASFDDQLLRSGGFGGVL
jgi:hypothetical protein